MTSPTSAPLHVPGLCLVSLAYHNVRYRFPDVSSQIGRTVPTIVFHADRDPAVHPNNGDHVLAQAGATAGDLATTVEHGQVPNGGRTFTRILHANDSGTAVLEQWTVHRGGHAWSGGSPEGSYTDPRGPDASREMLRFFLDHPHPAPITDAY